MDVLQASGAAVLCCPADLVSYSAITRYVIREFGQEERFRLRPHYSEQASYFAAFRGIRDTKIEKSRGIQDKISL